MPAEHATWLLPVAREAYKNRKEIAGAWERFTNWLFGEKRIIAFTGCAGIGKTVLLDHLTGDAYKRGYHPPDESQESERGKISEQRKRIHLVTVPGQNSGPRYEAFNTLITDRETIDGVVHVVANGFASMRSETAKEILQRDQNIQTIEAYRQAQLKIELEDLQHTCEFIRRSHQRHHRPPWLLIAVAKLSTFVANAESAFSREHTQWAARRRE
jgi:hypothetical protein